MASPYENALKKSFMSKNLSEGQMPLDKYQKEQNIFQGENPYSSAPVEDLAPVEPGLVESGKMSQSQFDAASKMPGGANEGSAVAGAGADALIAFGDPSMKAVGLGLKTLQAVGEAKAKRRQQKYEAELERMQARQKAILALSDVGRGLKV
jgi:hypothetical protein